MIPKVILHNGGLQETIELSAGARSRLDFLIQEYGNETAVLEAGLELLVKVQTNPNLSAGAKQRLKILTKRLHGSETAIIEMALQYLMQRILNSLSDRPPRNQRLNPNNTPTGPN
jgi:Flp pilus assembly protein TadD